MQTSADYRSRRRHEKGETWSPSGMSKVRSRQSLVADCSMHALSCSFVVCSWYCNDSGCDFFWNKSGKPQPIMTKFGIRAQGDSVERSERRYNTTTRRCPRDQKRNRKLICMTSSVERLEQMWVVLSEYATYLNQLWYIAQETQNHHCGTCHIHLSWKSKIAAAAILKCRKTSISPRQTIATTSARWLSPYMESRALA